MKTFRNITLISAGIIFAGVVVFNPIIIKTYSQDGLKQDTPYLSATK